MATHRNLKVRFYPNHGEWTCVVQRLGPDGMPMEPDVLSASGPTKDDAARAALASTDDVDLQQFLHDHAHV